MKKVLSIVLCLGLILSLSLTALAADQSTNITTKVEPTYTVTIPADTAVPFGSVDTDFGAVTLSEANLENGYVVEVTAAAGEFKNKANAADKIAYAVISEGTAFTGAVFSAEGETAELDIHIEKSAWDAAKAGEYEATVTFTVEYKQAS